MTESNANKENSACRESRASRFAQKQSVSNLSSRSNTPMFSVSPAQRPQIDVTGSNDNSNFTHNFILGLFKCFIVTLLSYS